MTLQEQINEFMIDLKASGKSDNTVRIYRFYMDKFVQWCEKNSIDYRELTGKKLRKFRNYLVSQRFSASLVNMTIYTVKSFYDFLAEEEIVPGNPVIPKRLTIAMERRLPDWLPDEEVETIFSHDSFTSLRPHVQLALRTMLASGLRVSEVANLRPRDVILQDNIVLLHVFRGKRKKERYVPVVDKEVAKELIEFRKEKSGQEKLFKVGAKWLMNVCRQIGLATGIHFHSHRLRHTIATRLLNNGVSLDVVQELLGHEHISTTRRYAVTLPQSFFRIAAKVS